MRKEERTHKMFLDDIQTAMIRIAEYISGYDFEHFKRDYYFDGYLPLLKKGKEFSQYYVEKNPNPKEAKAKSIYDINVPLYFFEGVNDHVIACAPELVVDYCKTVKAPKKEIIWFKNSSHYISVEEPLKFQDELIKILKENN